MKKLIKISAVCLLIAIVAMTFTSCGLFSSKADKIKDRLKDEDFAIASIKSDNDIEEFLDDDLFSEYEFDEPSKYPEKIIFAQSDDGYGDDIIVIFEFKNAIEARLAYYDDYEDVLDTACNDPDAPDDCTYGITGGLMYLGTVDACKDAIGFPMNLFIFEK